MSILLKYSPLYKVVTHIYCVLQNHVECVLQPWCDPVGDSQVNQSDHYGPACGSIISIRITTIHFLVNEL